MLVVTAQSFTCVDRSDSATGYQDGCIGDKYKCITSFYWQKGTFYALNNGISLTLGISGHTITDNTVYATNQSPEDFSKDFSIGETIALPGSSSNTGKYLITGLTPAQNGTGSIITVSVSLTNETPTSYIWVTDLITDIDYLYNLLPTNSQPQFGSLTDINTQQKYIVSGLNAADTSPVYFTIGTKSNGWVTDTLTGNVSLAFIAGVAITSDYKQEFTITHYYEITPLGLGTWLRNFTQDVALSLFPIGYAYGINAYYSGIITPIDSFSEMTNGQTCFVNQNNAGTMPEFSLESIIYTDAASGNILTSLDFTKTTQVTITIKSASGLFSASNTIVLAHAYIPFKNYIGTSTTLRQNFMNDRAIQTIGGSSVNGEYYGSDYSVLQDVVCTKVNTTTATITCNATYASFLQNILKSKVTSDRNYILMATIETTAGNRVAVLCDCNLMGQDKRNPSLFSLVDYFHVFPYPTRPIQGVSGVKSIAGMEGDQFVVQVPFRVQSAESNGISPILNKVVASVVAIKSGEEDFIVESTSFNPGTCLFKGTQQINIIGTKGLVSYANDPFNSANLANAPEYDSGTKAGYLLQYGVILRYDYWNSIIENSPAGGGCNQDINNDIENVNNAWSNLTQNGWSLVLRFEADIAGYDGYITAFVGQIPIQCTPAGTNSTALQYATQTILYDADNNVISAIGKGTTTRIRNIFTPNGYATNPDFAPYGTIFIDLPDVGGISLRRFASSEIPSEPGSPFAATSDLSISGVRQYAGGGMRIGWGGSLPVGVFVTETIYNDAGINWSQNTAPVPVVRLGFKYVPLVIGNEDGNVIGDEDGNMIAPDE